MGHGPTLSVGIEADLFRWLQEDLADIRPIGADPTTPMLRGEAVGYSAVVQLLARSDQLGEPLDVPARIRRRKILQHEMVRIFVVKHEFTPEAAFRIVGLAQRDGVGT